MSENHDRPLLEIKDLYISFDTLRGRVKAVTGVSLSIQPGQVLGLIGESGSGKTVTAKAILQVLSTPPGITGGEIWFKDQDLLDLSEKAMANVRGTQIAMISQDPLSSLNPVFTVGEQLIDALIWSDAFENSSILTATRIFFGRYLKLGRRRIQKAAESAAVLLRQMELPSPNQQIRKYPHELSGGMRQRVLIAMAWAGEPELIIADEPTTALDVTIQAQILNLLRGLVDEREVSILYISHDLGVVAQLCDRVAVMYAGEIVEEATTLEIFENPQHPYTQALLQATSINSKEDLLEIPGEVPNMITPPSGCHFWPRCPMMIEQCQEDKPRLAVVGMNHFSKCGRIHGEWSE